MSFMVNNSLGAIERKQPTPTGEVGVVRFENVGLRYGLGPEVLRDLSFNIGPHSFQFLTGPSGAGKTSLLRLLYLSLKPTRGLITLFGHDVATLSKDALTTLRRRVGIVFQDFRLLDHMTTYENVSLPLRVLGKDEATYRDEVVELLRWVGLGERLMALPPVRSGGHRAPAIVARRRTDRECRSGAGASVGQVVCRAQQVGDRGRDCDPRYRSDGPVRRTAAGAARRSDAYLRVKGHGHAENEGASGACKIAGRYFAEDRNADRARRFDRRAGVGGRDCHHGVFGRRYPRCRGPGAWGRRRMAGSGCSRGHHPGAAHPGSRPRRRPQTRRRLGRRHPRGRQRARLFKDRIRAAARTLAGFRTG